MPGTAVQRQQIKPQFITDFDIKDSEAEEGVRTAFSSINTSTVDDDGTGGAGETVVKKTVKKLAKPEEEKIGKKVTATISDKIPKKNAQKAKGGSSLSKSGDKTSPDRLDKTKAASGDKVPAAKEECVEKLKTKTENRKSAEATTEKKPKSIPRKPGSKATKRETKLHAPVEPNLTTEPQAPQAPPETPIPVVPIAEEPTTEVANSENETVEPVKEPPQPTTANPLSHNATCSFFEKLQLGVKAYFGTKNSFAANEKNKKEGGINLELFIT